MDERGAGICPVENAIARVLDQDALQSAREPGALAVAEHDDGRSIRDFLGEGGSRQNADAPQKDDAARDDARGIANPTECPHRTGPRADPHPRILSGY
jgi:hypothetical protein